MSSGTFFSPLSRGFFCFLFQGNFQGHYHSFPRSLFHISFLRLKLKSFLEGLEIIPPSPPRTGKYIVCFFPCFLRLKLKSFLGLEIIPPLPSLILLFTQQDEEQSQKATTSSCVTYLSLKKYIAVQNKIEKYSKVQYTIVQCSKVKERTVTYSN